MFIIKQRHFNSLHQNRNGLKNICRPVTGSGREYQEHGNLDHQHIITTTLKYKTKLRGRIIKSACATQLRLRNQQKQRIPNHILIRTKLVQASV